MLFEIFNDFLLSFIMFFKCVNSLIKSHNDHFLIWDSLACLCCCDEEVFRWDIVKIHVVLTVHESTELKCRVRVVCDIRFTSFFWFRCHFCRGFWFLMSGFSGICWSCHNSCFFQCLVWCDFYSGLIEIDGIL